MNDKSFLAEAAKPVIRLADGKKKFTDRNACTAYITSMAKQGAKPVRLPRTKAVTGYAENISEELFRSMQYFSINNNGGSEYRILYLHGGSYFAPPNIFHWEMLIRLAKLTDAQILFPMYPRAPIHTCSAAYDLLYDFYTQFFTQDDGKKAVIMGDSAGGGLACGLAQQLKAKGAKTPDKLILISPWLDVSMENKEMCEYEESDPMLGIYGLKRMGKMWAGSLDVHDPRVSPIYGDFDGIGEITLMVGTREIFYPDVTRLAKMLDENQITYRLIVGEDMYHVWATYPMREGREAVGEIAKILSAENDIEERTQSDETN